MERQPFTIYRPRPERTIPLIVHLPHVGRHIPQDVLDDFRAPRGDIDDLMDAMYDHDADRVFWSALHYGGTLFVNNTARIVYDPSGSRTTRRSP